VLISLAMLVSLGVMLLVWRVPPLLYGYVPDQGQRAAAEAADHGRLNETAPGQTPSLNYAPRVTLQLEPASKLTTPSPE
jgi:hypothetical protein